MKKYNTLTKIVLYVSFLSGVIWTGTYLLRMFLFYQLFSAEDLALKEEFLSADLSPVFYALLPAVTTTFITFIIFLITFFLFFIFSKIKLRENGWFFIILMIVIITAPFEIYLMTIDADIISGIYFNAYNSDTILDFVVKRFKTLSSFPVIEILSYFAIIYLALFKPLTRKYEN
jgi:uncharacterized MnhB-related membrane protein